MKIEIELEYVEELKNQIKTLTEVNESLRKKLQSLDEDEIRRNTIALANKMFNSVIMKVFDELKFDYSHYSSHINFMELNRSAGENWWESDKLDVQIGATITNNFRRAFLILGIKND